MAAGSLNRAMPALVEAYKSTHQRDATVILGATGSLSAQLENGAPADLFFAADEATVDRLVARGTLDSASRIIYARGVLTLVWRTGIAQPATLQDLTNPRFAVVALANPDLAPYGAAARSALQASALWTQVLPRIVYGENIAGAWQLVQSGNADVGLVARSVIDDEAAARSLPINPSLYPPLLQAAASVSASKHPDRAAFLAFVQSVAGQDILRRHGFDPPR
ncbi:MAG: molybdate ABC transporter substrate-binding protein [Gemmatimonadaceae bacterium]|nr:molybdate ABC transporter substrate-binding protein [Gemmatimonadaceae bacterium]